MAAIAGTPPPLQAQQTGRAKLSLDKVRRKISSIGARQIGLVGSQIVNSILDNLGPIAKARAALQTAGQRSSDDPQAEMMMKVTMSFAAEAEAEKKPPFLSREQRSRLSWRMLQPVEAEIRQSFSIPEDFLETGLRLKLTDYKPVGILAESATKIELEITVLDVPPHYEIELKLDQELTRERGKLVFTLTQITDGAELSKKPFTLQELEKEFHEELKHPPLMEEDIAQN